MTSGLEWTSKANEKSGLVDISVEILSVWLTALSFVSVTSGILIVYSPWLPTHEPPF